MLRHAIPSLVLAASASAFAAEAGEPARLALVDAEGTIVNVVVAKPGWIPPEGLTAVVASDDAEVGGTLKNKQFQRRRAGPATDAAERRRQMLIAHIDDVWTSLDGDTAEDRDAARQRVRAALAASDVSK
jgi:hypothetical protein